MSIAGRWTSARQNGQATSARPTPFEVGRTSTVTGRMRSSTACIEYNSLTPLMTMKAEFWSHRGLMESKGAMGSNLVLSAMMRVRRVSRFAS